MVDMQLPKRRSWHDPRNFAGVPLLVVLAAICQLSPGRGLDVGGISILLTSATPLVIAAIGQTQIVLAGGQGLAAGSTALLVNALVITHVSQNTSSIILWSFLGILIGGAIGAANGLLVGFLRLPSTAVTLSTSFIVGGVTLGLADAAAVAPVESQTPLELLGTAAPIAIIAVLLAVSLVLDGGGIGRRIRAVGQDGWSAIDRRDGVWVTLAYVIAGLGYGISGVLEAAQTGPTDPLTDGLSLAEIYAAVVLGGSVPYVRQGSTFGAAIGALFIGEMSYGASLLELPDYTAPILVAALLLAGLWRAGAGVGKTVLLEPPAVPITRLPIVWFTLSIFCAVLAIIGHASALFRIDPLILGFAGLLALAEASVVVTGHFDMSLPAITAFAGAACVALSGGFDGPLVWLIPALLATGTAVGIANGASSLVLRAPRVLATIATSHLLEAASAIIAITAPYGFAPSSLMTFMNTTSSNPAPALYCLAVMLGLGLSLAALPTASRWLRRLTGDSSAQEARQVAPILHAFAGFLAAAVGIMLAGYGGSSPASATDPFTLPSLLAIELAGFTIGRRGGNPWMLVLSVPLVVGLDTLMVALGLSYPARVVIMGSLLFASIVIQGLDVLVISAIRRPPRPLSPLPDE